MDPLHQVAVGDWTAELTPGTQRDAISALESGKLLFLPDLSFRLRDSDRRFLSPAWASARSRCIRFDGNGLHGAQALPIDLGVLRALMVRYRDQATVLLRRLFPDYAPHVRTGSTTYHPYPVRRVVPYRRDDDTRLHIEVDPARPLNGDRILRVCTNINPDRHPHIWSIGEPFEQLARRFLPDIPAPVPGIAWLFEKLGVTRGRRSEYDRLMLALHDKMKADIVYQGTSSAAHIALQPGTTWVAFTDQVVHAAVSGQFVLAQTFYLPVHALADEATSPLRVLERLIQRPLPDRDSVAA